MRVFFKKMGLENIRFKPAYNPYTEVRFTLFCLTRLLNVLTNRSITSFQPRARRSLHI